MLPLVRPVAEPASFRGFLFIGGLHRSGTTLVENRLVARFRLAALRAEVPENEGQHLQDVYPAARVHGGPGAFAFAPEMAPAAPSPDDATAARARLLACWTPWLATKGPVLVEKSPPNLTKIAWLRLVFPGARFVMVVRDPNTVVRATQKWSKASVEDLLGHWAHAHRIALTQAGEDCLFLRYEDYTRDPAGHEDRIATFAGLAPRVMQREPPERFRDVVNLNERYEPIRFRPPLPDPVWENWGYRVATA